jgi:hypothetical protein
MQNTNWRRKNSIVSNKGMAQMAAAAAAAAQRSVYAPLSNLQVKRVLWAPAAETNNEVNREMAAQGEADQYLNINVMQGIICPSLETLQMINTLHCECTTC